jgi:hypothetical protein
VHLEGEIAVIGDDGNCIGYLSNPEVQLQLGGGKTFKERGEALQFVCSTTTYQGESLEAVGSANQGAGIEEDFAAWIEHHHAVTDMRTPAARTKIYKTIKAMYEARREEGYSAEDLRLAVVGAYNDQHRREHGYYDHVSVLRPTMVHKLAEKGRRHGKPTGVASAAGRRNGTGTSMADREQAMLSLTAGSDERNRQQQIVGLVRTIVLPPASDERDPFTDEPVMQPDEARRRLAELVPDVDAAISQNREQAMSNLLRWRTAA